MAPEGPRLLFLGLNSSQGKALDNIMPLGELCLPLAYPVLSSLLCTGAEPASRSQTSPWVTRPQSPKMSPASSLLTLHESGGAFTMPTNVHPSRNTNERCFALSIEIPLYHLWQLVPSLRLD